MILSMNKTIFSFPSLNAKLTYFVTLFNNSINQLVKKKSPGIHFIAKKRYFLAP